MNYPLKASQLGFEYSSRNPLTPKPPPHVPDEAQLAAVGWVHQTSKQREKGSPTDKSKDQHIRLVMQQSKVATIVRV